MAVQVRQQQPAEPVDPLVLRRGGGGGVRGGEALGVAPGAQPHRRQRDEQCRVLRLGRQRGAGLPLGVVEASELAEVLDALGGAGHKFRCLRR